MKYSRDKYNAALHDLQQMRRDLERAFSKGYFNAYALIISDASGVVHKSRDEFDDGRVLQIDVSKNLVTLQDPMGLRRIHEPLADMGVPHVYTPDGNGASITMDLDDALRDLATALSKKRSVLTSMKTAQRSIRQR